MSKQPVSLEICISADDVDKMSRDLHAAKNGGAHRIELCASMQQDGLTPSLESIQKAREILTDQVLLVMVRPRGGHFSYSEREHDACLAACSLVAGYGADGIVFGALTDDGEINQAQLDALLAVAASHGLTTTFHRAFDVLNDPVKGWRDLEAKQVGKVLTSGTRWGAKQTALQGLEQLKQLRALQMQTELVIGGGIDQKSAQVLLDELRPGDCQLSLHTYSGVMTDNLVAQNKVSALAQLCEQI